jgi:glutamyl-tRNA reductase
MRIQPNETLEQWADRVQKYEHGHALMRIAQGDNVELVLEEMSRRIVDKLKHPILDAIRKSSVSEYDLEKSKKSYEETYLSKMSPRADHVESDT